MAKSGAAIPTKWNRVYVTIRISFKLLVIIVCLLAFNPLAYAMKSDVTNAYSLYQDGKIKRASDVLKPLAEMGDVHAAYVMGLISLDSYSSVDGTSNAVKWFVKASQGGLAQANIALGNIYHNQWVKSRVLKEYQLSRFYYRKARNSHVAGAKENLALLEEKYLNYTVSTSNQKWAETATPLDNKQPRVQAINNKQHVAIQQTIARKVDIAPLSEKMTSAELRAILDNPALLDEHRIVTESQQQFLDIPINYIKDSVSAVVDYLMIMGSSGQFLSIILLVCSTVFTLRLGKRFFLGIMGGAARGSRNNSRNNPEDLSSYMQAAKNGDKFAQYSMAQLYENSYEPPESHRKANHWYRLSAEQGYPLAQYKLAVNYLYGYGFPRNSSNAVKAVNWLNLAVEQKYVIAIYELGRCYENGWGVKKDINFALGLYSQASKSGFDGSVSDVDSQPEFQMGENLVACPYCYQSIRIPDKLPSSIIRCQACSQKFSITLDRFGNQQILKEEPVNYVDENTNIDSTHDAFDALGINKSSDSDAIKNAYRENIARYHPDKILHLGGEFQGIAEHKTKKIVSAYQYLRGQGLVK